MTDPVRDVARAVLYEGHVLWPYRRSALKNQQRWTFGGVYPEAYARSSGDRSAVQAECLLEGGDADVDVEVRFLHVVHRQVLQDGEPADEVEMDGERHLTWDEATERTLTGAGAFEIEAGANNEPPFVRTWERLTGRVDVEVRVLATGLRRVTVRIVNTTPWQETARDEAMRRTLVSAHVVIRTRGGALVSAIDPPQRLAAEAAGCRNDGLWPVLVGADGERHTMLAAPIILYDYPQIAPESPGDFFDGCEIDQLLVLNILGLTDEERSEMRASDPRARELLDRTEAMAPQDLMRLHGTMRDLRVLRP